MGFFLLVVVFWVFWQLVNPCRKSFSSLADIILSLANILSNSDFSTVFSLFLVLFFLTLQENFNYLNSILFLTYLWTLLNCTYHDRQLTLSNKCQPLTYNVKCNGIGFCHFCKGKSLLYVLYRLLFVFNIFIEISSTVCCSVCGLPCYHPCNGFKNLWWTEQCCDV